MKPALRWVALFLSVTLALSPVSAFAAPVEDETAAPISTEDSTDHETLSSGQNADPEDADGTLSQETNSPEEDPSSEPEETPQPITVSYVDAGTTLLQVTIPAGTAPTEVPQEDASGSPITAWIANGKKVSDPTTLSLSSDTTYTVWTAPALNTEDHIPYISGKGNASFAPNNNLTRAEAAVMLSSLLQDSTPGSLSSSFSDVAAGSWYYTAVTTLSSLGILSGYSDGTFRPTKTITRAEFVTMLSAFFPLESGSSRFSDVTDSHWARQNILSASAKGWISGYSDGTFRPDKTITRAEAVTVLNAVLGRSASEQETTALIRENGICIFTDVKATDWYYAAVMEASTTHTYYKDAGSEIWTDFTYKSCGYEPGLQQIGSALYVVNENRQITFLSPGLQTVNGKTYYVSSTGAIPLHTAGVQEMNGALYCFNADGSLLTDASSGYLYFGSDGKYTTGNSKLDTLVQQALAACTDSSMTREQKLRASYLYLRENCTYLARAHHARGSVSWYEESATWMFTHHNGNCYCYAASFMYMARALGYQAYSVSGGLGTKNSDHAWVMINGRMYDPELEYAYLYRLSVHRYYNLYNISPSSAPFVYVFPR